MANTSIAPGMRVIDSAGDFIGTVKDVGANDFQVDRRLAPDISISFGAVASARENQVKLNIDIPELLRNMGEFPHE